MTLAIEGGQVRRTLEQLLERTEPAWPLVQDWISQATNPVEVLPCSLEDGATNLLGVQVTTRSPMGALAYNSGGLFIDHGWLRVLGAPCERMPRGIADWNRLDGQHRLPGALLIADDVLGGFFAINGGALPGQAGSVFYWAPDTLEWEDSQMGFSHWLWWALKGDLGEYYQGMRWPGWEEDVAALPGDKGLLVYPFLSAQGPPIAERHRGAVPLEELWGLLGGGSGQ